MSFLWWMLHGWKIKYHNSVIPSGWNQLLDFFFFITFLQIVFWRITLGKLVPNFFSHKYLLHGYRGFFLHLFIHASGQFSIWCGSAVLPTHHPLQELWWSGLHLWRSLDSFPSIRAILPNLLPGGGTDLFAADNCIWRALHWSTFFQQVWTTMAAPRPTKHIDSLGIPGKATRLLLPEPESWFIFEKFYYIKLHQKTRMKATSYFHLQTWRSQQKTDVRQDFMSQNTHLKETKSMS